MRKLPYLVLIGLLSTSLLSGCTNNAYKTANDIDLERLEQVIQARPAEDKARDQYRRPQQTLAFFQVAPGMTVAEGLPGGGWYSKILAPYLGSEGGLYGINYSEAMWPMFGFFSEERMQQMAARTQAFPGLVAEFTDVGISAEGFTFATVPDELSGTADRVLFIRALHNLHRFEATSGMLTEALNAAHKLLKSDGFVGVVQHRAPESADDSWANGANGYLKQSTVIRLFEEAGFTLVASTEINANPSDQPSESDSVWRLPPSFSGVGDDEVKRAELIQIGESDRMTLLFKKQ